MKITLERKDFRAFFSLKPKISTRMKIAGLFLTCFLCTANASGLYSQTARISIEMKNATVEDVLNEIEKSSQFHFIYNNQLVNVDRKVNVDFNNESLESILKKVFNSTDVEYSINDKQIILRPKNMKIAESSVTQQQKKSIKGVVSDPMGPVAGANVSIKGTTIGTITDMDGNFTLEAPLGSTLLISYIGYNNEEVKVGEKTTYNILIKEDTQALDEVVVVGYGVQKKVTVTGAVSAIGSEEIVAAPVANISNALVGRLPGIRVQNTGGMPGQESSVDIRGFGKPLILVDGIEQPGFQVDPNEIESISVLKDASAAIYGVKAGNGVLLITTKKGGSGKAKITYNGSVGFQNFTNYPNVVNAAQYAELVDEDAMNHGNAPIYGPDKLALFKEGTQDGYKSYNWKDILTRKNAPQTQHNVNINGGNEDLKYFASVGYLDQQGIYSTGDLSFSRYNFRSNLSAKIAKNLTAEIQLGGHISNKHSPYDEDTYIIHGITRMLPTFSPYANDAEGIHYGLTNFQNPLARADSDVSGYRKEKKKLLNGSFSLKYDMPFVPGLSAKMMFSYLTKVEENKNFAKEFYLYSHDAQKDAYNKVFTGNSPSNLERKTYTYEQNLLQLSLTYNRTFFDKHNVSGLLMYEQREDLDDYVYAYRQFAIDALDQINAGMDKNKNNGGVESEMANVSFIGRINYDYMSKYLVEFAFREDGSAKFYRNNRWGFFPSVSVGWRLSEEDFIKNNTTIFDNLKIRGSYGKMGDDQALDANGNPTVLPFQYLTGYNYPGGTNYIFGSDVVNSVVTKGLSNLNYSWLTSKILNVGIDASFWNRMLEVNIDAFYRKREGLIAYRSGSLPNTFGASFPQENLNSDDYRGFELVLGHSNNIGEVSYSVKGNMSFTRIKNRHIDQADPINSYSNWRGNWSDRWKNMEFGYKHVGQFQNQEQINNWAVQDGAGNTTLLPGDLMFEDYNGDGVINDGDIQPIGRSNTPEIYFGLDLGARWRGFDISVLMQGASNYTTRMDGIMGYSLFNGSSALVNFMDRWHRVDPYDENSEWIPGYYPSTYNSGKESNKRNSTFNTIKSHYLRIKNLEFGYTFPSRWMNKAGISNLRVYLSGNNILTFDNLPFGDPEAPSSDRILYPQLRIWNVGVNLSF